MLSLVALVTDHRLLLAHHIEALLHQPSLPSLGSRHSALELQFPVLGLFALGLERDVGLLAVPQLQQVVGQRRGLQIIRHQLGVHHRLNFLTLATVFHVAPVLFVIWRQFQLSLLHDLSCLLQMSPTVLLRTARRKDLPKKIVHLVRGPVLGSELSGLLLHFVVVHEERLPPAHTLLIHVSNVVALACRRDRYLSQDLLCVAGELRHHRDRLRNLLNVHIYVRSLRVLLYVPEADLQINLCEGRAVRLKLIGLQFVNGHFHALLARRQQVINQLVGFVNFSGSKQKGQQSLVAHLKQATARLAQPRMQQLYDDW